MEVTWVRGRDHDTLMGGDWWKCLGLLSYWASDFVPPTPITCGASNAAGNLAGRDLRRLTPSWLNPPSFSTELTLCGWVYWEEEDSYTCPWLPKHWAMAFKSSLSRGTFLCPLYQEAITGTAGSQTLVWLAKVSGTKCPLHCCMDLCGPPEGSKEHSLK